MDVSTAVQTRISVRTFTDDPVSRTDQEAILDAGRLSQSGHNSQHWEFVLVDDPADLEDLAALSNSGDWVADAACAVLVVTDPERYYHEIDAGRAVTHMQFAAWERGIASCIFTNFDAERCRERFGVPDALDVTAVVGFGYPTFDVDALRGVKDRQPLDEVASYGSFDAPLPWSA